MIQVQQVILEVQEALEKLEVLEIQEVLEALEVLEAIEAIEIEECKVSRSGSKSGSRTAPSSSSGVVAARPEGLGRGGAARGGLSVTAVRASHAVCSHLRIAVAAAA